MNNKKRLFATILSLAFMLLSFNHCVVKQKTASKTSTATSPQSDNSPTPNSPSPTPPPATPAPTPPPVATPVVPPQVIQATEIDVGVKNFEQIYETMSVLTGVSTMNNSIQSTYEDIEVQLPTGNSIKSFLAANQVAITKLAAEYCDQLVRDNTLRSQVWPGLDFNRSPASELNNNTQKFGVIDQTLNRFWGTQVGGSRNASQLEMFSLLGELLNGENLNSRNTTQTVVKGICTAALASAQVTIM